MDNLEINEKPSYNQNPIDNDLINDDVGVQKQSYGSNNQINANSGTINNIKIPYCVQKKYIFFINLCYIKQ